MTNDRITKVLQDLGKRARDSEEGYRTSAEDASDFDLKSQFQELARERGEMADELDRLIRARGGEPSPRGGSTMGAMHRTFVDLKSAISGRDRQAILREIARGESAAEASYDAALREDLPADVRQVVERQHVRVRETRNRYRAMSGYRGTVSERMMGAAPDVAAQAEQFVQRRPMLTSMTAFFLGTVVGLTIGSAMMSSNQRASRHVNY